MDDPGDDWPHIVSTITPGVSGDSGSAFLDSTGRALGVLSNGVGDLRRELEYMHAHSALTTVQLTQGTVPFSGDQLPLAFGGI